MALAERYINAAKDGHVDILRNATRKDLNTPDEDGMTATLWAARLGKLEALRLIVGRQGDVNVCDYLGLTALHHAALQGHIDIVTYLTNWGCNVYALDNESHSALDLASMQGRDDIVRYLDRVLAQKQADNPKQVMRLREEAMKQAEANIKKYEKLQDAAAKRAEKEKKRLEKEIEQQQNQNTLYQQNGHSADEKKKKSFIKTLTLRIKPKGVSQGKGSNSSMTYSDMTGLSQTSGPRSGIAKKIQSRQAGTLTSYSGGFRVSDIDNQGNRTLRSVGANEGLRGSQADVLYMTASRISADQDSLGVSRRPMLHNAFYKTNIYKAKSESDLLDSGNDSYNGNEEDDLDTPEIFNRPGFGHLTVFSNKSLLSTMQSFEDTDSYNNHHLPNAGHRTSDGLLPEDAKRVSGDGEELIEKAGSDGTPSNKYQLPWDQDDLGNLDDDEEDTETSEHSAVEMFLWSCGLANYFHIFTKEEIDVALLMDITDKELQELGLPFGPRKKLKEAIARRRNVLAKSSRMEASQL